MGPRSGVIIFWVINLLLLVFLLGQMSSGYRLSTPRLVLLTAAEEGSVNQKFAEVAKGVLAFQQNAPEQISARSVPEDFKEVINMPELNPIHDDETLIFGSVPLLLNGMYEDVENLSLSQVKPLMMLSLDTLAIAVPYDSPYSDFHQLVSTLKAKPDSMNLTTGSAIGELEHMLTLLALKQAGVNTSNIHFLAQQSNAKAMEMLLSQKAQVLTAPVSFLKPLVEQQKVRMVAVYSNARLPDFAETPTLAEMDIDVRLLLWNGLFGHKNMTDQSVSKWQRIFQEVFNQEAWQNMLAEHALQHQVMMGTEFEVFLMQQSWFIRDNMSRLNGGRYKARQ